MSENVIKEISKQIATEISAQMKYEYLSLNEAIKLITKGQEFATKIGIPMVFTVVDAGGNLIAEHRMDGALLASIEISRQKAYTAVCLHMSTEQLAGEIQPGRSLYGLQNNGNYCVFGGGVPLVAKEQCIGAIGVSGGTARQDTLVVKQIERFFYEGK
ncbi:hypothetical protein lbkm_1160 [Lachnospiraceae bacterium KM106-2]|nr:hypothetical protein lbkm_1160 [Lachnospiraceae bacterium KM106-2]